MRQETEVTVKGVPLCDYMESIIVNTVSRYIYTFFLTPFRDISDFAGLPTGEEWEIGQNPVLGILAKTVVSSGWDSCFFLDFPPLEYIPIIPPHSAYVIVLVGKIIDVDNDMECYATH